MMKTNLRFSLFRSLTLALLAAPAALAAMAFDFEDPKGVNNAQFRLDAPLEIISGYANGVSGTIHFDPKNPESAEGSILIDARSLSVGNPMMKDHLHGENWLDVSKYPEIKFVIDELKVDEASGDRWSGTVTGTMTIRGEAKELSIPVSLTYLPGKLGARNNDPSLEGDLLVVRSEFSIERAAFGIRPGQNTDKVGEMIEITLNLVGAHQT